MIEKGPPRRGQLDPARTAGQELGPDLVLQIPDLPAERGLRGVQPPRGRIRQAPLLGDGDELAQMPQFHGRPMPARYGFPAYKVSVGNGT